VKEFSDFFVHIDFIAQNSFIAPRAVLAYILIFYIPKTLNNCVIKIIFYVPCACFEENCAKSRTFPIDHSI